MIYACSKCLLLFLTVLFVALKHTTIVINPRHMCKGYGTFICSFDFEPSCADKRIFGQRVVFNVSAKTN